MKHPILKLLLIGGLVSPALGEPDAPVVNVYKSPTCGCCDKWVEHLESSGFTVRSHNTADLASHKARLGVPLTLGSCHTAEVGGYVVEGHVPAREIRRLLQERPAAWGLAVPAMPIGSPGMEQGDHKDPYEVLLVSPDGGTRIYARY